MLFTEARFYGWLAFALVAFWGCPARLHGRVLLGLSVVFCLVSSLQGSVWLAFAFLVTWAGGRGMLHSPEGSAERIRCLKLSLAGLVGMLVLAKVGPKAFPFLTPWVAGEGSLGGLPLGISYFTFHCLGYLLDIHWGKTKPMSMESLGSYVTFFPKFVMGPIARSDSFKPQLDGLSAIETNRGEVASACFQICTGLFMKFVLADRMMIFVDGYFKSPGQPGIPGLLAAALFCWQLYYDFFGYSLIAVGTGRLFGIRLPNNFNRPFFATSVSDFWNRWHISLSSWFQEYFYTPLRFKFRRRRRLALVVAGMSTFLAIGLWHGTGWTFVLLGLVHGTAVTLEALSPKLRQVPESRCHRAFRVILTFLFVSASLVLFRASSLSSAMDVFRNFFDLGQDSLGLMVTLLPKFDFLLVVSFGALVEVLTWRGFISGEPAGFSWAAPLGQALQIFLLACIIAVTWVFGAFGTTTFLYNQF